MKRELLRLLVCPSCKADLRLMTSVVEGTEIMEGRLQCCDCATGYPITHGVPRFVASPSYAESFGYEWHRFRTVQLDSANQTNQSEEEFTHKTGLHASDIRGSLVLDAGVGAGRYAEVIAKWGGEVVGVDLTPAVDAAFENVGHNPRVNLIQADIFALPLREESFDLVYSIGVLHHTPDTARAFSHVSTMVRKNGFLAVYIYPAAGLGRYFSDAIRVITTRLPLRVVYALSSAAVPLYYPYHLPLLGRLLQTVAPISLHPHWRWRWLDTFDWYSPRYQWKHTFPEVLSWFRTAQFTDLYAANEAICIRAKKL